MTSICQSATLFKIIVLVLTFIFLFIESVYSIGIRLF